MKKLRMPHPFVLIIILVLISTILTYIIPSGSYQRVRNEELGRDIVDPASFTYIDQTPVNPWQMVQAIPKGMTEVAWIMILIFMVGGAFQIITTTGAVEAGLNASINKLKHRDKLLILGIFTIFSLGGATFGLAESTLIFIPVGVMLAKALGYDAIMGMAIVNVGATCGFAAGWMNIFTVGVAQGIAQLPLFSGMGYRIFTHVVVLAVAVGYLFWYGNSIRKDPTKSLMYGEKEAQSADSAKKEIPEFDGKRKRVLIVVLIGFCVLIYGITHGWSTGTQISSLFLVMGVVAGYVGGLKTGEIASAFVEGARNLTFGALLVGLCRAMVVVMTEGSIIDTILHSLSSLLAGTPKVLAAGLMVIFQSIINFFINSGSGQASATMPIMAPLADVLGISRQTAVLAFQYGDGLSNSLWPTSGILLAGLSIAGINYEKWLKFAWKLMVLLHVAVMVLCMISVVINYQ